MSLSPDALIAALHAAPPEAVWLLTLVVCFAAILLLTRLFGALGLYAYIVLALIAANVQVLKPVQFSVFADPVALGTVLFSSTYLCTDILAEHYGRAAARRGVWLGFATFALWTVLMMLTLGFAPMTPEQAGEPMAWALGYHDHMSALFTPAPAFFVAGMCAYLLSQFHDIWIYTLMSRLTRGRFLWLRNNASTLVSGLIDNIVFSVLAWVVFAPEPIGFTALVFTYILGTYGIRVVVAMFDTPAIYLAGVVIRGAPRDPIPPTVYA